MRHIPQQHLLGSSEQHLVRSKPVQQPQSLLGHNPQQHLLGLSKQQLQSHPSESDFGLQSGQQSEMHGIQGKHGKQQ